MKILIILVLVIFSSGNNQGENTGASKKNNIIGGKNHHGVEINLDDEKKTATVLIGGDHFTTYRFGEDLRIPILWPVFAEGDVTITRNYPMRDDESEKSTDHVHHRSIWTTFGDVNGHDFWADPPKGLPIISQEVKVTSGEDEGVIKARNIWVDDAGKPIMEDWREYQFYNTPSSARIFDHKITLKASYGDITFGDYKEGFIAFRIRPEIQGNKAGVLTNARGDQGEQKVYGTPVEWMDYSGYIEGAGQRGIALFIHPDNFRLPAWHVRDYGLAGANFFAMKNVAGLEDGSYVLSHGEELTLYVRFLIHSGDVDEARVQEHYEEYARTSMIE